VHADLSYAFEYDPAHRVFDPALGGGSLLDLGVYPAHLAWLLLGPPMHVDASCLMAPSGVDAATDMTWHYSSGQLAHLTCSLQRTVPSIARIIGSKGTVTLQAPMQAPISAVLDLGGRKRVWSQPPDGFGYLPEIREVEHHIIAGALESPRATLDDSIGVITLLDDVRSQLGIRYPIDQEFQASTGRIHG
jgi:predicted dehydrogenase